MELDTFSDLPIDEESRRRFEAAWRTGQPDSVRPYLPAPTDSLYAATLEALVQIDLEFAWKARLTPPRLVEHYLASFPELAEPEALRRLLRQEKFVRQRSGDSPQSDEYKRRFPSLDVAFAPTQLGRASPNEQTALPKPTGFEMVRTVGSGGMGVVYEVRQESLDRVIALKMMRLHPGSISSEARSRFLAEARIAARLEHPSVVPVHEIFAAEGAPPFYTMKLVRGRTLDEAIKEFHAEAGSWSAKTLGRQRLLNAVLTVAKTMAFAHSRDVIHRDLKPANIVLGDYGETVILDWGLAKLLSDPSDPTSDGTSNEAPGPAGVTAQGSVLGTPAFMSPEQANGKINELDARSDIFSLGSVLYQVLTGKLPFFDDNPYAVLEKVIHVHPPGPRTVDATIPRPLEAICLRALAKRPNDRYASAALMASDLENHLAGEQVSAYRERPVERLQRWSRNHRTLVASGAVGFVLLLLAGVAGLFLRQEYVNERQRQASEFERKQNLQRLERQQALERSAGELDVLAAAEIRAGRFDAAEKVLYRAVSGLASEVELAPFCARLEARRARLRKLAEFYRLWNRSERLATISSPVAFLKIDADALAACREALKQVDALDRKGDWWQQMPDEDLDPAQRKRLRIDTAAALSLAALWQCKNGMLKLGSAGSPSFRSAREYLAQVQAYSTKTNGRPSPAAEVLDNFCLYRLGLPLPPNSPGLPVTAADAYFLGTLHLFVSQIHDSSLVRLILQQIPRDVLSRIGIDFTTPRATADRLLRTAATLEPVHYWAHFWLGYSLYYSGDIDGAEMAFNTCVSLRPEYMLGYTERCQVQLTHIERFELAKERLRPGHPSQVEQLTGLGLAGMFGGSQVSQAFRLLAVAQDLTRAVNFAETDKAQAELKKRMLRGILQAADRDPLDPVVQWVLGLGLDWSGRYDEARDAYLAASELEAARRLFDPNWEPSDIDIALQMRRIIDTRAKTNPYDPKMQAASASIYLAQNDDSRALNLANTLLPPMDQAVQGAVFFRRKEYDKAAIAFAAGLAQSKPLATPVDPAIDPDERIRFRYRPGYALSAIGQIRAREALGKSAETLAALTELTQKSRPDLPEWQKLEGYVGQARLLAALGRETEARQALEDLRQLDTSMAQAITAQLFPPKK